MADRSIETTCIIGAGFMGTQIALQFASHGFQTWLVGHSRRSLEQAMDRVRSDMREISAKMKVSSGEMAATIGRLHTTLSPDEGLKGADLCIEAVPERLEMKRSVFAEMDHLAPSHAILATNSSSMRVSEIEDATKRPDRVLNTHFYPPVWERPMVELMRGTRTSDETIDKVRRFARSAGLIPLTVLKESTGFIFNRVWRAIKRETLHLVEEGVASFEDVDRAWMVFTGMRIGPFGLMDLIGLDVVSDIERVYYRESMDPKDAPPKLLLDKVERGDLGVKTGRGFYAYPHPPFEDPEWLKGERETEPSLGELFRQESAMNVPGS